MNDTGIIKRNLAIIWFCFAGIFASLGIFHFYQSSQSIEKFTFVHRQNGDGGVSVSVKIAGMDVDAPFEDFSKKFNEYIEANNTSNERQNLASFAGYVAATLTALLSAAIELSARRNNCNEKTDGHSNQTPDDKRAGALDEKNRGETAEETRHAQDDSCAKEV
jgi:hypothetical protein